jgi:hypothetical protein
MTSPRPAHHYPQRRDDKRERRDRRQVPNDRTDPFQVRAMAYHEVAHPDPANRPSDQTHNPARNESPAELTPARHPLRAFCLLVRHVGRFALNPSPRQERHHLSTIAQNAAHVTPKPMKSAA